MSQVKVIMPKLGLTMTKGTIIEWKKQEGEIVKKDEAIAVWSEPLRLDTLSLNTPGIPESYS